MIPSLLQIPSAVSDSKLHSVLPNNGKGDFTFDRSTGATRINKDGLIEEVGYFSSDLITNGDFASNIDNWAAKDCTIVWDSGKLKCDNSSGNSNGGARQNVGLQNSTTYKLVATVQILSAGSNGTFNLFTSTSAGTGQSSVFTGSTLVAGGDAVIQTALFTTGTDGDVSIQFSVGVSNAIYTIDNVSLVEVTGDRPRLSYDITNGVVEDQPHLLLEPSSTNLVTFSEDFSQSYWAKNKLTVTPNAVISPTGELNASLIQETSYTTSTNSIDLQNAISLSAGTYTLSFYVKNNKGRYLGISFGSSSERVRTNFDFNTNTFKTLNLSGTTTGSASFTTLGDFYRLSVTATFPSTVPVKSTITPLATDTYPFFANQDSDNRSFYMWGVQWEELSYPTSYIPTAGTTITRAAETCNNSKPSVNSTEGVLYAEIQALVNDNSRRSISISDGSSSNRVTLRYDNASNRVQGFIQVSGSTNGNISTQAYTITDTLKIAYKWKASDFALWVNGTEANTSTSSTSFGAGVLNEIDFDDAAGGQDFYGKVKGLAVYNEALTDAQLIELTN